MKPKLWLLIALLMARIGVFEAATPCQNSEQYSITGMLLRGHTFKTNLKNTIQYTSIQYSKSELSNGPLIAVPLGSIQELPAESCSEIKASEGNEMVNGDYWIYSDGNEQTILARCEENWQKINTELVCFGARNNRYGAFNITKSGLLRTMKLIHMSGSIKCNPHFPASYWGCANQMVYGNNGLLTNITNAKKEIILPPAGDLKAPFESQNKYHFYVLDGSNHTSPELVFPDLPNKVSVSRNQELQIWYGQDWINWSKSNNNGTTCVDVYAWYA